MAFIEGRQYRVANVREPCGTWLDELSDARATARVAAHIGRTQSGPRVDWKAVRRGVLELHVDDRPSYRVYCAQDGTTPVPLLCDGGKRSQRRDIEVARGCWQDYQDWTRKCTVPRGKILAR